MNVLALVFIVVGVAGVTFCLCGLLFGDPAGMLRQDLDAIVRDAEKRIDAVWDDAQWARAGQAEELVEGLRALREIERAAYRDTSTEQGGDRP